MLYSDYPLTKIFMKKLKLAAYSFLPALVLAGAIGVQTAYAHGPFGFGFGGPAATPEQIAQHTQERFQRHAEILGISADEVKAAWAEGKSFSQIIQEKNLSREQIQARIKDQKIQQAKSQLQTLVEKGVITRQQADQRLAVMQERIAKGGEHMMGKGLRHGFGF